VKSQGKIAIVTGATSGIGFEVAKRFGKEGWTVVLNGRNDEVGAKRAEELTKDEIRKMVAGKTPVGREGRVDEVADLVVYLASKKVPLLLEPILILTEVWLSPKIIKQRSIYDYEKGGNVWRNHVETGSSWLVKIFSS